jgi:CDP-glucose 4,6-dehydratase
LEGFNQVYKNKTVLVTGHTGFKGSWLSIWLTELGARVIGFSLDPKTDKDNFVVTNLASKMVDIRGDIRDSVHLEKVFEEHQPEFVFHLAAQPLVRKSYELPTYTFETNVMGTINVLEAIRKTNSVKVGIFATTDKVYQNQEKIEGYVETDPLGGYDPYSSSKASAELAIQSWRDSYFNPNQFENHRKSISSVRAGNVIGGGDWSEDRLIPDLMRSITNNQELIIRNPHSIRPWQHVLDPLNGYLILGEKMFKNPKEYAEAWNFGPNQEETISVLELIKSFTINKDLRLKIESKEIKIHETKILSLNSSKAKKKLDWVSNIDVQSMISFTRIWYLSKDIIDYHELCLSQIKGISSR